MIKSPFQFKLILLLASLLGILFYRAFYPLDERQARQDTSPTVRSTVSSRTAAADHQSTSSIGRSQCRDDAFVSPVPSYPAFRPNPSTSLQ
jgi:hypothetical protein